MTGSSDTPDRRENSREHSQTGPPYPYPDPYRYQPAAFPGGYPPPPPYGGYPPHACRAQERARYRLAGAGGHRVVSVATVFAPIALGVVAVVIGVHRAWTRQARHRQQRRGRDRRASCWARLAIVVGLAFIAIWTTVWKDVGGGDYIDCMQKAGTDQSGSSSAPISSGKTSKTG